MAAVSLKSPIFLPVSLFDDAMARCAPFESRPALAVAVSGGIDSMALLLLTHAWATARGGCVTALTVNHHLRPEAALEAAQVARWCEDMGIRHHTLDWTPPDSHHPLQEKAREGRYALMSAWCHAHDVLHLLTAHTQDDQRETLFFRLARGSQMEGLACMPLVVDRLGIRLLRPLLHTPKAALLAYLQDAGQGWVEDASNQSMRYTRNRIRKQLSDQNSLVMVRGTDITERLAAIRNSLFYNNVSQLTNSVSLFPEGYAIVDVAAFAGLGMEARARVLAALIPALNGGYHPPRAEALARLNVAVAEGKRCNLAGLCFAPIKQGLLVAREAARLPSCFAMPLQHWDGVWDARFKVSFRAPNPAHFSLRRLGKKGLDAIYDVGYVSPMRILPALRALPSLWHLEELVAVPHISYRNACFDKVEFTAVFCSLKPLAGSPFFSFNSTL